MKQGTAPNPQEGTFYQITVSGRLSPERSGWFDGLAIEYHDGVTVLSGRLADPQALYGVIERIRDLGMELKEVKEIG